MTPAPAKFRFDLDLGRPKEAEQQPQNTVLTHGALAEIVAQARNEGLAQGRLEGAQSASVKAAERLAAAAEQIASHVAALNATLDDSRHRTLTDAVGLAAAIGRKLASHLLAQQPAAEIEALIAECLASLDNVPHLVIRCAPDLAGPVREIAEARIATSGFTGRLVVMGDPDRALGDAKLEWVDGGIIRDRAALEAEIDQRIQTFLAAHRGPSQSGAH